MKKRVFFMLLAAMMMPFLANAQVNSSVHIDTTVDACVSYTWNITGETLTTTGVYTQVMGDTLYILDLTIHPVYNITVSHPVHGGCTYTWGDTLITDPGVYTKTFTSIYGCDSTVTINLILDTIAYRDYTVINCGSYRWKDTLRTTTGIYHYNHAFIDSTEVPGGGTVYHRCDSVLTLDLTIINPYTVTYDTSFYGCLRVSVLGATYRSDTVLTYIDTTSHRSISQCYDSIRYYRIYVRDTVHHTEKVSACDSYTITVGSTEYTYNYGGTYSMSAGKAANGCDSIFELKLTVNRSPELYVDGDLRVTHGTDATLNVHANQSNVSFLWFNGSTESSTVVPNVQGNTDVYVSGTSNSTGCSATAYVTILCNAGINSADNSQVSVYPNPTNANVSISSDSKVRNVSVFNVAGQRVLNTVDSTIDMSVLVDGTYVLRIEFENGNVATHTVILNK